MTFSQTNRQAGRRNWLRAGTAASLLILAGCDDDPQPEPTAGSGAAGEVQGGTISDAMLPIESVTSQAPSRGEESGSANGDDADQDAADAGTDTQAGAVSDEGD